MERHSTMSKFLIIAAAVLAIVLAAPATDKRRVSLQKLYKLLVPFHEPTLENPISANVSLLTVTQRVDNLNPQNLDTWQQRYYINNEFYQPGSPIFIFLGGQSAITDLRVTESHMYNIARELNANIFQLEHRYYGESRPTGDASTENLVFLNTEQALADIAHFINHIKNTVQGARNSHFILVGVQYSASLAVWFRQRYPHLVLGVWASGAPLPSIVDFDQYKVAIGTAFRNVGSVACYNALEAGFTATQAMLDAGQFTEVSRYFNLCWDLGPEDVSLFFIIISEIYARFPSANSEASIRGMCALLLGPGNPVQNIAEIVPLYFEPEECLPIDYEYIVEADRQTEWNATAVEEGYRQWSFHLCSQIGWFHTSGSPDQPFGNTFPVEKYHELCRAVFGDTFTPERIERNSNRFNTFYGGLEPQVTNTVFVYGQHDPWNIIGRTTNLNEKTISIVIAGAVQATDLPPIRPADSPAVVAAKLRIQEIINEWINEADS